MHHRGFIIAALSAVFLAQTHAANVWDLSSNQQASSLFRIIQTPDGNRVTEHLLALPDGQQRYIIELEGKPVLEHVRQLQQLQQLQQSQPGHVSTSAIAPPVVMQLERQVKAEQAQLLNQMEYEHLITETFATTQTLINTLVVAAQPADIEKIAALHGVKKVHPDRELRLHLQQSVPLIGADQVWKQTNDQNQFLLGTGIRVGVIDTGIDYTHPDLGGCFGEGCKVAGGYDFYDNDADPIDHDSHGTHVAGIIAANGVLKGVAPEATLYAYRVCAQFCPTSFIVQALERAADPDQNPLTQDALDVVNLSLGGPGNLNDLTTIAANNASLAGIVVVISAGNEGNTPNAVGSPGNAELAITVAASNQQDAIASFSSRGPSASDTVFKPDVAAPGDFIKSTTPNNEYGYKSGTSMAAPHVAGAAALLKQQQRSRTPAQIKSLIVNSAKDLHLPLPAQGSGRLDVLAAANTPLSFSPQSISFGKFDSSQALWFQQKSIVVRNAAAIGTTITLEAPTLPAGVTLTFLPGSTIQLAANASQEVQIQLRVDPAIYQMPDDGAVVEDLSLNIRHGQTTSRFALAFLAYHQLTINTPQYAELLHIYDEKGKRYFSNQAWDQMGIRMPSGTYDVIASFTTGAEQRLVVLEQQEIKQQQSLLIDPAAAVHEISLTAVSDRDGAAVPLAALQGGVHALEIRHQSKPIYFQQMYGVLGDYTWDVGPGRQLTPGQSLWVSSMSDKFQLALTAFWKDRRAAMTDMQLYSWTQRYTGMHQGETVQLSAATQNRLVTTVAAAAFPQNISFSYTVLRSLVPKDISIEDASGTVGYGNRIGTLAANQSATVSIYGTAASFSPYYGVGLFELSLDAHDYKNSVSGNNWRFKDERGAAKVSVTNHYGMGLLRPITYDVNPQGQQYLTTLPHWANFYAYAGFNTANFTVNIQSLRDIYGSYIQHYSTTQNPVEHQFLLRCDHQPGTLQQSAESSYTFANDCDRYDAEIFYTTALLDQPVRSFSRLLLLQNNNPHDLSLSQVRIGYNNQPSQYISQGKGFFELSGYNVDSVSAELHYQGQWRPLAMQLTTPDANTLSVYRAEFNLPDTAALASVRYIAKTTQGNRLESVFHNAAIIGPQPETALLLDNDTDGIPDYQDPDDDNDGISDIDELRYRLDLYKDDRQSDLDNDGLTNLQELELMTFPDNADTDTDGMADGFEHQYGLAPLDNRDTSLDPDQDGLTNLQEFSAKTNPKQADTDGDTLPDGWEVKYGLNALDAGTATQDPDQDELNNLQELQHNTDPLKADTDKDGLPDGWEVKYSLNPLDATTAQLDTDQDSLNNLQEFTAKTDPTKADTDGDGLPDGWEVKYSLNPLDAADAASDRDNDGATALQEFGRNTDPTVSNLVPKPAPVEPSPSGGGGSVSGFMLLLLGIVGWRRRFKGHSCSR